MLDWYRSIPLGAAAGALAHPNITGGRVGRVSIGPTSGVQVDQRENKGIQYESNAVKGTES